MGSKGTKDLTKEEYQECCGTFKDYLLGERNSLNTEEAKRNVIKKFEETPKKAQLFTFIETLIEKERHWQKLQ